MAVTEKPCLNNKKKKKKKERKKRKERKNKKLVSKNISVVVGVA